MLFTANRIKACCTGYKSKSLRIYSLTKKRNQESRTWDCLWQTNGWPTQYVARRAIRSLMQSRKSKKMESLMCSLCKIMGSFLLAIVILNTWYIYYFFPHAVHVEMKGEHGYLSASDWPLYPVMWCCSYILSYVFKYFILFVSYWWKLQQNQSYCVRAVI